MILLLLQPCLGLGWAWQEVRKMQMRRLWDRIRTNITATKFTYDKRFCFCSPVNVCSLSPLCHPLVPLPPKAPAMMIFQKKMALSCKE